MRKFPVNGKKSAARIVYNSFIIGCGRIAGYSDDDSINDYTHVYAYRENSNVQLAGCMDIDPEKSNLFSEKFNCIPFNDYLEGVTKTGSEIVSVCTPDDTHYMIVRSLLEIESKIKVIFLEKPACSTIDEINHLIELSNEKEIDIVVNHTRRFDERYKEIRNNITKGEYGDLVNAIITYYSGWQHNGVHIIDTLSYLFDDTVEIQSVRNGSHSPYPNDFTIEGELYLSKLPGKIQLMSFDEKYYQIFEFDLRFEKMRLRIEDFGTRIFLERKEVNNIGENVLVMINNSSAENSNTPIQTAVNFIIERLDKNNPDVLNGFKIADALETMKTIYKGIELYED